MLHFYVFQAKRKWNEIALWYFKCSFTEQSRTSLSTGWCLRYEEFEKYFPLAFLFHHVYPSKFTQELVFFYLVTHYFIMYEAYLKHFNIRYIPGRVGSFTYLHKVTTIHSSKTCKKNIDLYITFQTTSRQVPLEFWSKKQ